MLFQPTNIYPDQKGGELGNGTIDVTKNLPVSWQVNGNSPMTSFSITIYRNDAASTQLYTTGQRTDSCPFQPSDHEGVPQTFRYTIPASALSGAGMVNGGNYKLVIQQWYSGGSVRQSSASAFITRATPVLSLSVPASISTKEATFTASYSQAQADPINWVKWTIATADDNETHLYETAELNTGVLQVSYDGFFSGTNYVVRCQGETSSGVMMDTGWKEFYVEYVTNALSGVVAAKCDKLGAVNLEWESVAYISGEGERYVIENGRLEVRDGGYVKWDIRNGQPMAFPSPWTVIWNGYADGYEQDISPFLSLETSTGLITIAHRIETVVDPDISFERKVHYISLYKDGVLLISLPGPSQVCNTYVTLTDKAFYVRVEEINRWSGLYPAKNLYPSEDLYPIDDDVSAAFFYNMADVPFVQGTLESLTLGENQVCNYLQVLNREPTAKILSEVFSAGGYVPEYNVNTVFLANFKNGLLAGNTLFQNFVTGYSIYRRKGQLGKLQHIVDVEIDKTQVFDFSTESRQGPYTYYMFPVGETTYVTNPVISSPVTPCLQSWYILSCRKDERDRKQYWVNKIFSFGKNLDTGTVYNNNTPNVMSNLSRYPTYQMAPQRYQSGSLRSLIGVVGFDEKGNWGYWNTKSMRDAIWELSTTEDTLFLRSMTGDFLRVQVAGSVGMWTNLDGKLSIGTELPWVEVGSTDDVSVISFSLDGLENL